MAQTIELTNTLIDGEFACSGEQVSFTCTTMGSHAIAWISDEYIGEGGRQLEFSVDFDREGTIRKNAFVLTTFAVLTLNNQTTNTLTSTLHIIPSNVPSSSVTCIHVGNAENKTVYFETVGKCLTIIQYIIDPCICCDYMVTIIII